MDRQAEALALIRNLVRSGFYGVDEIAEAVAESVFHPDPVDEQWVRDQIEQALQAKRQDEAIWPSVTDCERLERVFDSLNAKGILALENAAYTMSDGRAEVTEVWHRMGAEDSDVIGYCFYHGQDLERVVDTGELWLAFGDIHGADDPGTRIGAQIVSELEAAGFTVEWDRTVNTRILIKGITWQKRTNKNAP